MELPIVVPDSTSRGSVHGFGKKQKSILISLFFCLNYMKGVFRCKEISHACTDTFTGIACALQHVNACGECGRMCWIYCFSSKMWMRCNCDSSSHFLLSASDASEPWRAQNWPTPLKRLLHDPEVTCCLFFFFCARCDTEQALPCLSFINQLSFFF